MNKPDGSTSALLEDPPVPATPDQEQPQGQQPEVPLKDEETQQPAGDAPISTETPPPPAEPKPIDKAKPADAPAKDPVQAAIEHLQSDGPKTVTTAKPPTKAQPGKPGEAKPTNGDDAEPNTEEGTETGAQPRADDPTNPLKDWTPQELRHTKGTVKQRFRELHTKVQEQEPYAVTGKGWTELIQTKQLVPDVETLDDDQIAWSIRAQGAAVRAVTAVSRGLTPAKQDLDTLDQLRAGIAEVDKAIGRRAAPTDPNTLAEAFTGQIPEDLKEAAELAGLSEKETRLIAALRTHKPAPATPPAAPAAPAPGAPTAPRSQAPAPRDPEAPAREAQRKQADQFWARKTNSAIVKTGVKPEGVAAFFETTVAPILGRTLARDYPGQDPRKTFADLDSATRHQLVMDCIAEHQAATRPPTPPPQPPGRAPLRAGGSPTGSNPTAADPVSAAISHLRSD